MKDMKSLKLKKTQKENFHHEGHEAHEEKTCFDKQQISICLYPCLSASKKLHVLHDLHGEYLLMFMLLSAV